MIKITLEELKNMKWPLKVLVKCYCLRRDEITFESRQFIDNIIFKANLTNEGVKKSQMVTIHRTKSKVCMYGHHEGKCECNVTHAVIFTIWYEKDYLIIVDEPVMPWGDAEYGEGYHVEPYPDMTDMEIINKLVPRACEGSWIKRLDDFGTA